MDDLRSVSAGIHLAPEAADQDDAVLYNKHVAEKELALSQAPTQPPSSHKKWFA